MAKPQQTKAEMQIYVNRRRDEEFFAGKAKSDQARVERTAKLRELRLAKEAAEASAHGAGEKIATKPKSASKRKI